MNWDKIIGQDDLKNQLKQMIQDKRVGHALLFLGEEGYGVLPLVLAFCREILMKENAENQFKVENLNHLDLHLAFPFYGGEKVTSQDFYNEFRSFILENPYFNYQDWANRLDSGNKQLMISVNEIDEISYKLSLKSYEGGSKVMVIWRADKMNIQASNKFLKLLEEPPEGTIIILTAISEKDFLDTIISRTQIFKVPRIEDEKIKKELEKLSVSAEKSQMIALQSQGDWNVAQKLLQDESVDMEFESCFIDWVRSAVMVKTDVSFLERIILWAKEISSWSRDRQKSFLAFCSEIFRLALLQNYNVDSLVYRELIRDGFRWDKFSKYISGANIDLILEEISLAELHISRNGNGQIIWTDLGIKMSRYLHNK